MPEVPVDKPILTPENQPNNYRDYRLLKFFLILLTPFAFVFWLAIIFAATEEVDAPIPTVESPKPKEDLPKPTPVIVKEPYETTLTAGNYICSEDIPIGTFTFSEYESGTAYIYDKGKRIEYIFFDNMTPEHKVVLKKGYIVSVCDVIEVKIKSINLDSYEITPRRINSDQAFQLKEGKYIAGKDFDAGIYNIKAISGNGCINTTGILYGWERMSNDDETEIKEYKNAILDKGAKLEVEAGLTIELIPVD